MASIIQIGNKWRATVTRKGHKRLVKTFSAKAAAKKWSDQIEAEIQTGLLTPTKGKTGILFADAITRYENDRKDFGDTGVNVMRQLRKGLGNKILDELTSQDVVDYVICRGYGPATAMLEMSFLGGFLNYARVIYEYCVPQITEEARLKLKKLNKIAKSEERTRRPTKEELDIICEWFDKRSNREIPWRDVIWFSIHSTFRISEVCKIRRSKYDPIHKTVELIRKDPKRRNTAQIVPLPDFAVEILERQPIRFDGPRFEGDTKWDLIFPYAPNTFSNYFPRACQALGIENLHWHDLRHEGISRLFEMGHQIQHVAMVSGHRDWKHLKRYTQLKAKDWPRNLQTLKAA